MTACTWADVGGLDIFFAALVTWSTELLSWLACAENPGSSFSAVSCVLMFVTSVLIWLAELAFSCTCVRLVREPRSESTCLQAAADTDGLVAAGMDEVGVALGLLDVLAELQAAINAALPNARAATFHPAPRSCLLLIAPCFPAPGGGTSPLPGDLTRPVTRPGDGVAAGAAYGGGSPRLPAGAGPVLASPPRWPTRGKEAVMPDKLMRLSRYQEPDGSRRPVMIGIAGDSAAGKTTLTRGIAEALGRDRATAVCADDYHRYDRDERRSLPYTVLNPDCNYIDIMEQHLQLLAMGRPILKPVYDHATGKLVRPVLVEPREFVIVEGLLPLHTKLARACFDITVYLDPPEEIRHEWKLRRDCRERGYTPDQVLAELKRREPESAKFIRPQRQWADIAIRFAPVAGHGTVLDTSLSAEILLRPTVVHPDLSHVLTDEDHRTVHLKLIRDSDGRPVDALHVHGYAPREDSYIVEKAIWEQLSIDQATMPPDSLGEVAPGTRSESLAIAQLLLLWHLLEARG